MDVMPPSHGGPAGEIPSGVFRFQAPASALLTLNPLRHTLNAQPAHRRREHRVVGVVANRIHPSRKARRR